MLVSVAAALGAHAGAAQAAGRCGEHPWCDTSRSPDARAGLLLRALTPEERIGLLAGDTVAVAGEEGTHTGTSLGVERVGLPAFLQTDGPVGIRQGRSTALPSEMALAASFDRRLSRAYGALVGDEAAKKGNDLVYAPTLNILRTPLWGRAFESLGEDPFLAARMAVPYIRGLQSQGVIANAKHFAVNNQEGTADGRGSRYTVDARVGERALREIYLPQFEAAVKQGRVGSVMCAYNRLNGPHACESRELLTRILRRDWGFDGFVLADYGASKTIAGALRAGLDYEPFPFVDFDGGQNLRPENVAAALAAGAIDQADVDTAVRRTLRTLFAFGFFDRAAHVDDASRIDRAAHARTAQRVAEAGTVLLRNRARALPLDAGELDSLAVVGADADRYVNGGGSSDIEPYSATTVRAGIAARAGSGVDVRYDPGDDLDRAAQVARRADAAVVVVADAAGEGADKPCLALDCAEGPAGGDQGGGRPALDRDGLVERVAAANPRTIVVLATSGPVLTPWRDDVEAIVEAWYPGQAAGAAVARVLFGDVDPGGRLPATFPEREQDLPTGRDQRRYPGVGDVVRHGEGVLVGYRWFDARRIAPAYPFGHGLSYTRMRLSGLRVRGSRVSFRVRNAGRRTGSAVPQLYVRVPAPRGATQPPRQLKGFARLTLGPGQARRVALALDRRSFAHYDARADAWRVTAGCARIYVGRSSRDLPLRGRRPVGGGRCGRR